MLRPMGFCLAFVLLAAVSPVTVPAGESSATESAVRGPDAPPRGRPDTVRHDSGNQTGSAAEETEPNGQAGVAEPDTTGPGDPILPEETEPAEIEPLTPIETRSSIRVNANVSLPQDI